MATTDKSFPSIAEERKLHSDPTLEALTKLEGAFKKLVLTVDLLGDNLKNMTEENKKLKKLLGLVETNE